LITLRDHGITPDYVREMGEQGYKALGRRHPAGAITASRRRRSRDARGRHGSLSLAEIVKARDHGITPEYGEE
jgi:hypothetical protein